MTPYVISLIGIQKIKNDLIKVNGLTHDKKLKLTKQLCALPPKAGNVIDAGRCASLPQTANQ